MANNQAINWSPQQAAFIDWVKTGKGSCVLEAVAGAGKTTVILGAIEALKAPANGIYLAYNKDIATETQAKLKDRNIDWKHCAASTVHSVGFRGLTKTFGKMEVNEYKVKNILDAGFENKTIDDTLAAYATIITQMVSMAKQSALGVTKSMEDHHYWHDIIDHYDLLEEIEDEDVLRTAHERIEDIIDLAIATLTASNKMTSVVDFDDMVYLGLVHRVRFWRYNFIFVDEAQDTNEARRALIRAILAPGGRVVAVGDSRQAIYGFTGADSDSLDLIAKDFNAIRLPLTITYRCPKAVVNFVHQWVQHIQAADTAPEGSVTGPIDFVDFMKRSDLDGKSAVLCRNTKPLIEAAFHLIREKIACKVEGRDIGANLIKLATRWKRIVTLTALETQLDKYLEAQRTKFLAKKQEQKAQAVEDQVETLKVIIDECRDQKLTDVADLVKFVHDMFADSVHEKGILTLSTIHKSKGREWKTVFWLDRAGTCPSRYARQQWQKVQEDNLCYVAGTRSMDALIEVNPLPKKKKG